MESTSTNENKSGIKGALNKEAGKYSSQISEFSKNLGHEADGLLHDAKEVSQNFLKSASSGLQTARTEVGSWIQENPMRAAMIAAGVGFAVGSLFRRSTRKAN